MSLPLLTLRYIRAEDNAKVKESTIRRSCLNAVATVINAQIIQLIKLVTDLILLLPFTNPKK